VTGFVALLIWLGLYGWLAHRLWNLDIPIQESLNLVLGGALIVSGVIVALIWFELLRHWGRQVQPFTWRALSIDQMLDLTPAQFEEYVAQRIFARQGYTVRNTPDTGDGGVDVLLTDRNGRIAVVQCKRYRSTVGEEIVRDLYGTMMHSGADRAFLVTTSAISPAAWRWAAGKPIELIDGARLVQLGRAMSHDSSAATTAQPTDRNR
jgi:restriction system protein